MTPSAPTPGHEEGLFLNPAGEAHAAQPHQNQVRGAVALFHTREMDQAGGGHDRSADFPDRCRRCGCRCKTCGASCCSALRQHVAVSLLEDETAAGSRPPRNEWRCSDGVVTGSVSGRARAGACLLVGGVGEVHVETGSESTPCYAGVARRGTGKISFPSGTACCNHAG